MSQVQPAVPAAPAAAIAEIPVVLRDPRFAAGRATVGNATTSIPIFATLLEESIAQFGDASIEAAPAYYEYGNALFRCVQRQKQEQQQEEQHESGDNNPTAQTNGHDVDQKLTPREAAALAAERRAQPVAKEATTAAAAVEQDETALEEANGVVDDTGTSAKKCADENEDGDSHNDDVKLALEMMETSWSILDNEVSQSQSQPEGDAVRHTGTTAATDTDTLAPPRQQQSGVYAVWISDELPRVLTGIGDVLSALTRHADAADAYLRALEHRQEQLTRATTMDLSANCDSSSTVVASSSVVSVPGSESAFLRELQCRRRLVETNILVTEELLACGNDHAVITSETKVVLVAAGHVIEYARVYYNKARDELQEAVLLLGKVTAAATAAATNDKQQQRLLQEEKENVCFAATMVMSAGEALAEMDEQIGSSTGSTDNGRAAAVAALDAKEPLAKKSKSS